MEQTTNKLTLVVYPDSRLTQKAKIVTNFDSKLTQFVIDMFGMMKELNGLGLSANQVGDDRSILVFKVGDKEGVMINPVIASKSAETHESEEGCLSFPGVYVKVQRHNSVTVHYHNESGEFHEAELKGLLADCIQHEIDHLNGKTMLYYLSKLKRDFITGKMKKVQKKMEKVSNVNRILRAPSAQP